MSEVDNLREDCHEVLGRLWFCHPLVASIAHAWIDEEEPFILEEYLETQLRRLERSAAMISHSAFRDAVGHFRETENFKLIVDEPSNIGDLINGFYKASWTHQMSPPVCLYAAANFLIFPTEGIDVNFIAEMQFLVGESLRLLDAAPQATTLLESYLELDSGDYSDRERLEQKLDMGLHQRLEANNGANFARTLADSLGFVHRASDAALVLEAYVGLDEADYRERKRLEQKLEAGLRQKLEANNGANFARALADALRFVNRASDAALMLIAYLGFDDADYCDRKSLEKKLQKCVRERMEANNGANIVRALSDALRFVNRPRDGVLVLEAYLGIEEEVYETRTRLEAKLQEKLRERLEVNTGAFFARSLAEALRGVNRPRDGALVLEAYLGLEEEVYETRARLESKLKEELRERLEANTGAALALTLADALRYVNRPRDGALVLEAYLGLDEEFYETRARLEAKLQEELRERLAANTGALLARVLAEMLRFVNRPRDGVLVLEAYLGLDEADYRKRELLEQKAQVAFRQRLEANTGALLALTLANLLTFVSRDSDAALVLDVSTKDFEFLRSNSQQARITTDSAASLIRSRLVLLSPGAQAADLVNGFIDWLRGTLETLNVDATNRTQVIVNLRNFRRFVIDYADRAVEVLRQQGEDSEALAWRRYGLEWEAWLGQRVLLEKMSLSRLLVCAGNDASLTLSGNWPLYELARPGWNVRSERLREFGASNNAALDSLNGADFPAAEAGAIELVLEPIDTARQARLRELARRPIGLGDLAKSIGVGNVLLRASVGDKGEIYWSAWMSEDGDMTFLAAQDYSRSGQAVLIERATTVHDFQIRFAYLLATKKEEAEAILKMLRAARVDVLEPDPRRRIQVIKDRLIELANAIAQSNPRLAMDFSNVFGASLGEEDGVEKVSKLDAWLQALVEELLEFYEKPLAAVLNGATQRYIVNISKVLDLSRLAPHLKKNAGAQLVFSSDGPLASVPLAFLPVDGKPLWRHVGSTRATLSLALDDLAAEVEAEQPLGEGKPSVLAGAWVQATDGARPGAAEFLHALDVISQSRDAECLWLADQPIASVENVCQSVHAKEAPHAIMALYGHGSLEQGGVELGPDRRVFNGKGCKLERIEFPIFVSCSVGRSKSSGARDFEGFCVALARQRARAALAASWAINSFQAAHFAAEVIDQYLRLRAENPVSGVALTEARLRSRAVAEARKNLLALKDNEGNELYLNTLAAFELWGLG